MDKGRSTGSLGRPLFEALEQRLLLSAASGPLSGTTPAALSWDWFETAASMEVAPFAVQLDADTSPSTETILWNGAQATAVAWEWIVQLSDSALSTVDTVDDAASLLRVDALGLHVLGGLGKVGQVLVRASAGITPDVMSWLGSSPLVAYYEPNFVLSATETSLSTFPNDTSFSSLWGLHNTGQSGGTADADIDAPEAWDLTTGSSDVVIAVIDTGIDYTHPDLIDNIWTNPGEIAGDGIDNDGNGFTDDIYGWDFAYDDADPTDGDGHGTHVAGTIGAVGNDSKGVVGVNWNVSLMSLKFLDNDGSGSTSDAIDAIHYATMMRRDYGVNIVATSNSWGGGSFSTALRDAIADSGTENILFIAAAGNGGNDGIGDDNDALPHYPSNYDLDNIIAVAATDRNDQRATWSNFGVESVDLAAPGASIYSTMPGSNYGTLSGTSMATPHVAGVVGLVAAFDPTATALQIKSALLSGADPISSMAGISVTGGRLNAYNALQDIAIAGPRVISVTPGAAAPPTDQIVVTFTEDIDPVSVVPTNFVLRDNGPDDVFDTGDDVVYTISAPQLSQPQPNRAQVTLGGDMAPEQYRLTVVGTGANPIRNLDGEALNDGADHVHNFEIITASGPFESNDTLGEATDTGLTGPGSATVSAHLGDGFYGARDVDIFTLQVATSANIIADIDASEIGTGLDPILRLFNAAGTQIAVNDDSDGLDSFIEVTNVVAGTYYVGVSGYSNFSYDPNVPNSGSPGSTGDYDLHVTISGGSSGGGEVILIGSQLILGINADASLIAEETTFVGAALLGQEFLTHGAPQASFTLAVDGATYQNNSPANDSPAIAMNVVDISSGSNRAARATGQVAGVSIVRDISFTVSHHYAVVDVTLTNNTGSTVNGVAWLENLDPDQAYPLTGSYKTNNDVMFNGRYAEAAVFPSGFPDGLTMAVGSPDSRAIASTEGFNVDDPFEVIDSPEDSEGVADDIAINLAFDVGSLSAGQSTTLTYYLIFDTSVTGARDRYQALIGGVDPFEPNDTLATATPTGLTTGAVSSLGTATFTAFLGDGVHDGIDIDLYAFNAGPGDIITADIDASQIGSALDPILRLFDTAGNELDMNDDTDGLDSFIQHALPTAGAYYIGVSGYSNFWYDPDVPASGTAGSTGDYDLILTLDPGTSLPGEIHGTKWNDLDGDGFRDAGEPGLGGWTIYLDQNGNGSLDPQTVNTVDSVDVPQGIWDYMTITSDLLAGGLAGTATDIDVTLDITHTWDDDLAVFLISPSGTRVELFSNVGGSGIDFTSTILDDEAATPIALGSAPFTGSFQPEGLLADFDGEDPNGTWTLEVTDDFGADTGMLNSWSIIITVGELSIITDASGNYAFQGLAPGAYVVAEVAQDGWENTFPSDGGAGLVSTFSADGTRLARFDAGRQRDELIRFVEMDPKGNIRVGRSDRGHSGTVFNPNDMVARDLGLNVTSYFGPDTIGNPYVAGPEVLPNGNLLSPASLEKVLYKFAPHGAVVSSLPLGINGTWVWDFALDSDGNVLAVSVLEYQAGSYVIIVGSGEIVSGVDFGNHDTPPRVVSVTINGGQEYRSQIDSLALAFDQDVSVSLGVGDLALYNDTTQQAADISGAVLDYAPATDTATWDMSGVDLADGYYTATLLAAGVTDASDSHLDGNGDDVGGDDYTFTFFVLKCDANGDGRVDSADLAIWQQNYDPLGLNDNTPGMGDWDNDGDIDSADLALWQQNYDPIGLQPPGEGAGSTMVMGAVRNTSADATFLQPPTEEAAALEIHRPVQSVATIETPVDVDSALMASLAKPVLLGLYLPEDIGLRGALKRNRAVSNEPLTDPGRPVVVLSEAYVSDSQPAAGDYGMPRQALLRAAGATSQVGMLSLGMDLEGGLVDLLAESQMKVPLMV